MKEVTEEKDRVINVILETIDEIQCAALLIKEIERTIELDGANENLESQKRDLLSGIIRMSTIN